MDSYIQRWKSPLKILFVCNTNALVSRLGRHLSPDKMRHFPPLVNG